MPGNSQHSVPHKDDRAVKGAGNSRAEVMPPTQQLEIDQARDIAKRQRAELLIHGLNEQVWEKDSYGNSPFPPKAE
jgi:hypothetical protein